MRCRFWCGITKQCIWKWDEHLAAATYHHYHHHSKLGTRNTHRNIFSTYANKTLSVFGVLLMHRIESPNRVSHTDDSVRNSHLHAKSVPSAVQWFFGCYRHSYRCVFSFKSKWNENVEVCSLTYLPPLWRILNGKRTDKTTDDDANQNLNYVFAADAATATTTAMLLASSSKLSILSVFGALSNNWRSKLPQRARQIHTKEKPHTPTGSAFGFSSGKFVCYRFPFVWLVLVCECECDAIQYDYVN